MHCFPRFKRNNDTSTSYQITFSPSIAAARIPKHCQRQANTWTLDEHYTQKRHIFPRFLQILDESGNDWPIVPCILDRNIVYNVNHHGFFKSGFWRLIFQISDFWFVTPGQDTHSVACQYNLPSSSSRLLASLWLGDNNINIEKMQHQAVWMVKILWHSQQSLCIFILPWHNFSLKISASA